MKLDLNRNEWDLIIKALNGFEPYDDESFNDKDEMEYLCEKVDIEFCRN